MLQRWALRRDGYLLHAHLQDTVRFVFGHRGHDDPEVYSIEQLLPARCVPFLCVLGHCMLGAQSNSCCCQCLLLSRVQTGSVHSLGVGGEVFAGQAGGR